jgi:hypothetical protein
MSKVAMAVERRPRLVITCVLGVSILMAFGVTSLSMTTDFSKFIPREQPTIKVKLAFEENFGKLSHEAILIEGDNVARAAAIRAILEMESSLRSDERLENYLYQVEAYTDYVVPPILKVTGGVLPPDPQLESGIQMLMARPEIAKAVVGKLITADQSSALVSISLSGGMSEDERAEVNAVLHEHVDNFDKNLKASLTGDITVHEEIYGMMNRDNRILIPVAILLVAVIILLVFKRISDVFVALVIVGLGSMWAVGTMGLLQLDFTMFHVALVPLLLGLGVDYSVHMLNRYYEEIGRGRPVKRAIFTSITTVGVAVSISTLTTMIGFSSFVTSSLVPFRTLGIFAALGILFTFILSITLLPAALVLRDRKMARDLKATITMREKRVNKLLTFTAAAAERHWKPITAAAVAVAALCAISAVGIPTTMSVELFVPEHVESVAALNRINEKFGGQSTIFVLAGGDVTSPEGLREMLMLENSVLHDKENPENLIRGAWSLADAVSLAGGGQIPADGEIVAEIIQQLEPAAKLLSGGTAVIYFFVNARTDEEGRLATEIIRRNVGEFKGKALDLTIDGEPAVGGEPVVITDILSSITPTLFNSTVVTIILCFLVLAILFRSLTTGLIALLPLLLTISWEFGTLRILGWPLDVLTMGISALIIGLGVDYSVHVIHRFREERERHGAQLAVRSTIMNIGTAMLTAATTTIGVFAVLSLSGMPAMGRFGVLTALVISYGIISALMILPSILVFRTSRGGKQAGL